MRLVSSTAPISIEKNSTGRRLSMATFAAAPSMNAVFPAPGRAATMTSVEGWRPSKCLSRSV